MRTHKFRLESSSGSGFYSQCAPTHGAKGRGAKPPREGGGGKNDNSPSPFLKMISLFWKSSSDIISGFSQFSHRGRLADDIILHSSRLTQEIRTRSKTQESQRGKNNRGIGDTSSEPTHRRDLQKNECAVKTASSVRPNKRRYCVKYHFKSRRKREKHRSSRNESAVNARTDEIRWVDKRGLIYRRLPS